MKTLFLLCFCFIFPVLLIFGEQTDGLCPTAAYGTYKKKKLPVFDVAKRIPLSQLNGKMVKLPTETITFERSDYYNPGFIEVTPLEFDVPAARKEYGGHRIGGSVIINVLYSAKIKVSGNFDDLYVIAICIEGESLGKITHSDKYNAVSFKKIGPVSSSDEINVKLVLNVSMPNQGTGLYIEDTVLRDFFVLPLFYSKGYEIKSNRSSEIYTYFRKKEETYHRNLLNEYVKNNAGNNLKHTPVIRFLPYLPPDAYKRQGPIDTAAYLTLDKTGKVRKVVLDLEDMDGEAAACITDGLKDWLFLPPLKEGAPYPFRIKVPLKY